MNKKNSKRMQSHDQQTRQTKKQNKRKQMTDTRFI